MTEQYYNNYIDLSKFAAILTAFATVIILYSFIS
jgi:hypothetical protein